jgi:hypothetical protein
MEMGLTDVRKKKRMYQVVWNGSIKRGVNRERE